jgi:prevent-host-death family protein
MRQVGIYEAKTKLPELLKQVATGEQITITNRGIPVADIVPSVSGMQNQIKAAISAIKASQAASAEFNQSIYQTMRERGRK